MMVKKMEGAGPFFFEGGGKGVLLIHGFTGCADEMVYLGKRLAEAGFTASLPLLPGHGTAPADMRTVSRKDWIAHVHQEFRRLAEKYEPVFVVGFSMGGVLALELAGSGDGEKVRGLVLLATPLKLAVPVLPHLMAPTADSSFWNLFTWRKGEEGVAIADPEERKRALSYLTCPGRAVAQLFRLLREVQPEKVHAPVLLAYSRRDPTVPFANLELLRRRLGSSCIETLELERSHHVISRDYEKDIVAARVIKFLESCGDGQGGDGG